MRKVVKLDEKSLTPRNDLNMTRKEDGQRSLATQYMNVLMTNAALSERKDGPSYRNDPVEGGQRIQTQPGGETKILGPEPGVSDREMVRAYRLMTGDQGKKVLVLKHEMPNEPGSLKGEDGFGVYTNQQEYEQLLSRLKTTQSLPVVGIVDVRNDLSRHPQSTDRPDSVKAACKGDDSGTSSGHALVIDDFSKAGVSINNQWSSRCDYTLPTKQAYDASVDTGSALLARIDDAKAKGTRDFAAEIEHSHRLMEMVRKVPGVTTESFADTLRSQMKEAEKYGKPELFNDEAAKKFSDFATNMLTRDQRVKLAEQMRQSPLFKKHQDMIELVGDIS